MRFAFLLLLQTAFLSLTAQESQIRFNIYFDDDEIGHVIITEEDQGDLSIRDMRTKSDAHVMFIAVHVETEAKVTRKGGVIHEGIGYRHANRGSSDVHAHTQLIADNTYKVSVNGETKTKKNFSIDWCVADLYFKEPKDLQHVYSNMYGDNLKVVNHGNGKYELVTPDDKNSQYHYKNGRLYMVEADTPVGKVITKRI